MDDRYLWNGTGAPDPEIVRLEQVLGTLRSAPPAPAWDGAVADPRPATRVSLVYLGAAAVLVLACAGGLWSLRGSAPAWPVVRVEGSPTVGTRQVTEAGRLVVGQWLETDTHSRATLAVSDIGRLDIDPGTRLRLVSTREGRHRLALPRGTVHAFIWAPPGQFVVDTPSSRAVDLGCAYTLHVDENGSGVIEVTAGWVAFEKDGRESLIPAGARCATRTGVGPGTPYAAGATPAFRQALDVIDFGPADERARRAALDQVMALAQPDDAFTLWHLIRRVPLQDRDRIYTVLAGFVPPPASVTRDGVRRGNREMLDAWWDAFELGSAAWWREWKREW